MGRSGRDGGEAGQQDECQQGRGQAPACARRAPVAAAPPATSPRVPTAANARRPPVAVAATFGRGAPTRVTSAESARSSKVLANAHQRKPHGRFGPGHPESRSSAASPSRRALLRSALGSCGATNRTAVDSKRRPATRSRWPKLHKSPIAPVTVHPPSTACGRTRIRSLARRRAPSFIPPGGLILNFAAAVVAANAGASSTAPPRTQQIEAHHPGLPVADEEAEYPVSVVIRVPTRIRREKVRQHALHHPPGSHLDHPHRNRDPARSRPAHIPRVGSRNIGGVRSILRGRRWRRTRRRRRSEVPGGVEAGKTAGSAAVDEQNAAVMDHATSLAVDAQYSSSRRARTSSIKPSPLRPPRDSAKAELPRSTAALRRTPSSRPSSAHCG